MLPLSITNVRPTRGATAAYVTTTISGAQFQPNAIVKLVMPGFAEYQPVTDDFVNATEIVAEFDLTGAPYGLYDVQVTNPDGRQAIAPYRFQVEQTIPPDVTIGVGGPRFILAGDTGTYSVALQNLGNINAPYVEFNVGIPQLSNVLVPADPSQPLVAAARSTSTSTTCRTSSSPPTWRPAAGLPASTRRCRSPRSSRRPTRPPTTAIPRRRATCSTRRPAASPASRST